VTLKLRLTIAEPNADMLGLGFDQVFASRIHEADEFYKNLAQPGASADLRRVQRQAFAGMLWSKQYYHYDLARWLRGDPNFPKPPAHRREGRNRQWTHLFNDDVISMPDKWEYPWYAAWDLAFHCIPLALVDPEFAKEQLFCCCANGTCTLTGSFLPMSGIRGCQPASSCLGGVAGLQDRAEAFRKRGPQVS
jgi:hypothetical protein